MPHNKCDKCSKPMTDFHISKGFERCLTCIGIDELLKATEIMMSARSRMGTKVIIEWRIVKE